MPSSQTYDPINPAPYQPVEVAAPTPPKPSPFEGQPGFQFQGHGNISHAGAIAGVFDNLLKGFVNGHAQGEAHKALLQKKKSDDLNASYNADAQRLYQMSTSGVDQNSPEYQAAKSAVDGSWGALQDYRGQLINGPDDGKKKKSKTAQQDESNPFAGLASKDPKDKAQALYALSKKAGPPVYGQIAALNTSQAQQARATAATQAQAGGVGAQNQLTAEQAKQVYYKYAGSSEEDMAKLPPAEQKQFENAKAILFPPNSKEAKKLYDSPDKKASEWYVPGTEPKDWNAHETGSGQVKVGSFGDFMKAAYGEQPTPEQYEQGRASWAKAGAGTTVGEHVIMVPQKDGTILPVTVETTSSKQFPGAGTVPNARAGDAAATPPLFVSQSYKGRNAPGMLAAGNIDLNARPNIDNGDGTHSSVYSMSSNVDGKEVLYPGVGDGTTYPARKLTQAEALDQYKKTGKNLGSFSTPQMADAYAKRLHLDQAKYGNDGKKQTAGASAPRGTATPPKGGTGGAGVKKVGEVIGGRETPEEVVANKLADARDIAYRESLVRLNKPTPIGDTGIVMDWVRTQVTGAGRMNNTELQQAINSGSWDMKYKNAYSRAIKGTLDSTFRKQMVDDIGNSAHAARIEANAYKGGPSQDNNSARDENTKKYVTTADTPDHKTRVGTNDGGATWFDVDSGKPYQKKFFRK